MLDFLQQFPGTIRIGQGGVGVRPRIRLHPHARPWAGSTMRLTLPWLHTGLEGQGLAGRPANVRLC